MLAVGNHADIALVLAQDIGQQFLAAHVLEAVAAPAVGKVADRLEVIYRIHLREEAGGGKVRTAFAPSGTTMHPSATDAMMIRLGITIFFCKFVRYNKKPPYKEIDGARQ